MKIQIDEKAIKRRLFESQKAYKERLGETERLINATASAVQSSYERSGGRFYGQAYNLGLSLRPDITAIDADKMRMQVRNLALKSTATRALLNSNVETTVDSGLVAHAYPDYESLGITQQEAEEWSKFVDTRFDAWAQDKRSIKNECYNFYQLQRMLQRYTDRDGETFLNFSYSGRRDLLNPLQLTILDPEQINGTGSISTRSSYNPTGDGIKRDEHGREVFYSVWSINELRYEQKEIPRIGDRSGRVFMTHGIAEIDYAGQGRGFSPLGVAVQDLDNILALSQSKLKKSINMSQIVAIAQGSDPFKNMNSGGVSVIEDDEQENESRPQAEALNTTVFDSPGSAIIIRGDGETLTPFNSGGADEPFAVFVDTFFDYISAACGTSPELVKKKFQGSYHDQRATLILCYRVALNRRYQMATDHLNTVYEMWLSEEIAAGRVKCAGWNEPRLRAAWARVRFVGTGIPNTEPLREINAYKEQVGMGLKTVQEVAEEQGLATDIISNIERNRPVFEKLRELGFAPWQKGYAETPEEKEGEKKEAADDGKSKGKTKE
ncbi:MAG: phage portal protein [Spirochaetaceae bacterium]|jgi:capsid protein|nr:phage portal protein [Spirochaetaceae bacterium]